MAKRVRLDQRTVEVSDRLCECGCGERTMVSPKTRAERGWVKGQPRRFVRGHQLTVAWERARSRPKRFRLKIVKVRGLRKRCGCGCGFPVRRQGCRYVKGHAPTRRPLRVVVRWREEDRGYVTPCWVWQLGVDKRGYGKVTRGGVKLKAHRVAYEDAHGPIPAGHDVHHRCEVKLCVNPDHLEPLTPVQHGLRHRDGLAAGLAA